MKFIKLKIDILSALLYYKMFNNLRFVFVSTVAHIVNNFFYKFKNVLMIWRAQLSY